MHKKCNQLLLLTFFLFSHTSAAFSQNVRVQDLKGEWLVYNQDQESLVPFVKDFFDQKSINFYLDLNKYQDYHLSLDLPTKTSLLIENRIVFSSKKRVTKFFNIDSLKQLYNADNILISIFSADINVEKIGSEIVDRNSNQLSNSTETMVDISRRRHNIYIDFFILAVISILASVVFVKQIIKSTFSDYLSVSSTFSIKPKSEALYSIGVFASSNILMYILYGLSLGFMIIMTLASSPNELITGFQNEKPFQLIGLSLLLSIVLVILLVLRYFLLRIVGGLYKMKNLVSIQFYDYLRITFFMLLVFFVLLVFNFGIGGSLINTDKSLFVIIFIFLLCLRPLFIFLKLNNLAGIKNLHLFSYICATELIPLTIIVKLFLN